MSEKWWDMSDDELDDLFREASDKVDVPFDSSAYNKLRQKIAEQPKSEPPKGFKKRWLLLLAGLFLMVSVGLVYRFGNDLKENNSTEIVTNIEKKNIVKNPLLSVSPQTTPKTNGTSLLSVKTPTTTESLQKEHIIEKLKAPLSVTSQTKEESNLIRTFIEKQGVEKANSLTNQPKRKSGQLDEKVNEAYSQSNTKSDFPNNSEEVAENKQVTFRLNDSKTYAIEQNKVVENINFDLKNTNNKLIRFNNSKNNKDREGKSYPSNLQIIGKNDLPLLENPNNIPTENLSEETINKTNFYDVDFLKNKSLKSLLTDIHTELPDYVDSLPRTMKPVKFSKFGMRLVLSPDFNSIENLGKMALGGSVGLLFEYKISKKLVVQTGMVYSKKSYIGSFDNYHNWSEWKGYHPSKPTEVDGGCKVIDVPFNLRLNLFQKPKQTWFVSSGISSYWMVNESYTYNYAWSPSKTSDWSDNSKYYFSVLNFSVGLEKQISKRFNLQVEPYLKTPLKNVGRGGVNLYSSGLLFSTKYEF
jgi:hypothetical protein